MALTGGILSGGYDGGDLFVLTLALNSQILNGKVSSSSAKRVPQPPSPEGVASTAAVRFPWEGKAGAKGVTCGVAGRTVTTWAAAAPTRYRLDLKQTQHWARPGCFCPSCK